MMYDVDRATLRRLGSDLALLGEQSWRDSVPGEEIEHVLFLHGVTLPRVRALRAELAAARAEVERLR